MVGKKIRAYREFRGLNQIQLAELSGINVGTIRKYELGLRNPKPEQLERIASALGLNVSIFLDFNIETVGDVLSLLFAIDDSVDLSLSEPNPEDKSSTAIAFTFKNHTLQDFIKNGVSLKMFMKKKKRKFWLSKTKQNARKNWTNWKLSMKNGNCVQWEPQLAATP